MQIFSILFVYILIEFNRYDVAMAVKNPIIGVMAQEMNPDLIHKFPGKRQYIAASYVKSIEGSGGRVMPIFIGMNETYYRNVLNYVNGVLLPGGGTYCDIEKGYCQSLKIIYDIILKMNQKGDFFPVLGICLGMEFVLRIANNMTDIQTRCNVFYKNLPLHFKPPYKHSMMYSNIPVELFLILKHMNVTHNYHRWCTTPTNLTKWGLDKDWMITTDNTDESGLKFISSIEHRKYPIMAIQFHPEKSMYEWHDRQNIPHNYYAIKANRYFFDIIVNLAKLNNHEFPDNASLTNELIYNYNPTYTPDLYYTQLYLLS